jgi:uncharacterized protein (TIGR02118 family)
MLKAFALISATTVEARESFRSAWRQDDVPELPGLLRYAVADPLAARDDAREDVARWAFGSEPPYDGVAELWFADEAAFEAARPVADVRFASLAEGEAVIAWLPCVENVVVEGVDVDWLAAPIKALFFPSRKPGTSVEAFQEHWRTKHAAIVPDTPHLRRYVQCHVVASAYVEDAPVHDGVAELWWADVPDMLEALASDAFQREQPEDAALFVDPAKQAGFVATERRLLEP